MTKSNGTEIKELKVRVDYIEKGISKAEEDLNKRLEGMNEFRESLKDAQSTFLTKTEYESKHRLLEEKLDANQQIIQMKLDSLQKIVYITVGTLAVLELMLRFLIR